MTRQTSFRFRSVSSWMTLGMWFLAAAAAADHRDRREPSGMSDHPGTFTSQRGIVAPPDDAGTGQDASPSPWTATDTRPTDDLNRIPTSRQRIIVITADWNANQGFLYRYERTDTGGWHATGAPVAVSIGRKGSAWGIGLHPPQTRGPRKREGDGRSPAGIFAIGTAFGYAASADTVMPYQAMRDTHYCIDVPDSPSYNRIVDADEAGPAAVAGSTEPMRLDLRRAGDLRYRLGLVIEHNPERIPGGGSCIFVHLRRHPSETTAGCTSMDEVDMRRLLHWLRPGAHPQFILLPKPQYDRWRTAWELPELDDSGR